MNDSNKLKNVTRVIRYFPLCCSFVCFDYINGLCMRYNHITTRIVVHGNKQKKKDKRKTENDYKSKEEWWVKYEFISEVN